MISLLVVVKPCVHCRWSTASPGGTWLTAVGQKADAYAHGLSPPWPYQAKLNGVVCGGSVKEPSDRVIVEAMVILWTNTLGFPEWRWVEGKDSRFDIGRPTICDVGPGALHGPEPEPPFMQSEIRHESRLMFARSQERGRTGNRLRTAN